MPDKPLDELVSEEDALASLHTSVGWRYMKKYLKTKRKQLIREFNTVAPNDSNRIAAIQAELKLINAFIDKPKIAFERQQNGG